MNSKNIVLEELNHNPDNYIKSYDSGSIDVRYESSDLFIKLKDKDTTIDVEFYISCDNYVLAEIQNLVFSREYVDNIYFDIVTRLDKYIAFYPPKVFGIVGVLYSLGFTELNL